MPVCPRQCHFGCVVVGIEHGVHGREARVALDVVAVVALAVPRVSLSSHCHIQSHGAKGVAAIMCLVVAKRATSTQWSELCCIGDTDGCLCVWFAMLAVWLVVYAPGTPMCVRVGFISW